MSPMITRRAEKEFVRQVADRAPIKEHHWDEMMIKDVLASDDWQLVLCMYLGNERFWEGTNFSGSNLKCSISFSIYRKVPSSSSRDQARPVPPAGWGREVCSPLSIMSHITQGQSSLSWAQERKLELHTAETRCLITLPERSALHCVAQKN